MHTSNLSTYAHNLCRQCVGVGISLIVTALYELMFINNIGLETLYSFACLSLNKCVLNLQLVANYLLLKDA